MFVRKEEEVGANYLAGNRGIGDRAKPLRGVARRSTFRELTALFTTESVGLWVARSVLYCLVAEGSVW